MKTTIPLVLKINQFIFAALLLALFSINHVTAATYYAITNGNWNINTTWSLTPGGVAVGVGFWPVASDIVYISEGATARSVTIPANYSAECASIYMGGANATAATLTLAASTSSLNVSGTVIIYGPLGNADRFIYVNAGNATIAGNLEMNNGQTGVQGNRNCRVFITTGTVIVSGDLVCNNISNSSLNQTYIDMSGGPGTFNLAGAFTIVNNIGTLAAGTTSTFNFNGSASGQIIPIGVSSIVYCNLTINNTHSSGATLSAAVTPTNVTGNISVQSGTLNNGGFAITLASTKNFSVANGATFNLTDTSTMVTVSGGGTKTFGPSSTVNYAGTNQAVTAESYGNLAFNDGGTKTMPAGTTSVYGDWTNNSTVDATTNNGAVIFSGSAGVQSILGSDPLTFYNLTLNNAAGALLGINTSVNNALTLTSGILSTGAFSLEMTNTAPSAISGASASNYINGNLKLAIAAGANTYSYPIGTSSAYAPVSIDFTAGTEAGSLMGSTIDGDHPDIITSSFSPSTTVNRYWSFMIVNGLATVNYDATFNWVSADQDTAFDYAIAYVEKYSAGAWTHSTMGTQTATSAQITGASDFSDFQVGNGCFSPPSATISGDFTTCAGDEVIIRVDLTGTPNWSYTWSDGTNTGTVTDVTESPSFFTVYPTGNKTYTIINVTDNVGCTGTASGSATVTTGPAAYLPELSACSGNLLEVPVTVRSFKNVGAISLTLNYDKNVITFDSYDNNSGMIDYLAPDESGAGGRIIFSGISETYPDLDDDAVLITLKFNYLGGSTLLEWDDSDDIWCEFAAGPPDFNPYCDDPPESYYYNGSVTGTTLVADFIADTLLPPKFTPVQLTDLSTGGATSWEWSFNRTSVEFLSGDEHSQNPIVQFTNGGNYTVTLTVHKQFCTATEEKVAYIRAGRPGYWIGETDANWFTDTNWDDWLLPNPAEDVIIPTVEPGHFYPHVPGNLITLVHCANIILEGETELVVEGEIIVNPGTAVIVKGVAKIILINP